MFLRVWAAAKPKYWIFGALTLKVKFSGTKGARTGLWGCIRALEGVYAQSILHCTDGLTSNCIHCILYPLRLKPPFPNDAQTLRSKASLKPNQILNWLKECQNRKYNLLNEQKSSFGNKMTKVALGLRTWVTACICEPKHANAARASET